MTKNTKPIEFDKVPNFDIVKGRIHAINPNVEFVKAGQDFDLEIYTLRIQLTIPKHTDLDLPQNSLSDLTGNDTVRRDAQLDHAIRSAIDRMN